MFICLICYVIALSLSHCLLRTYITQIFHVIYLNFLILDPDQVLRSRGRILVQVTMYRRLLIGRDGHLDQSEAYDTS